MSITKLFVYYSIFELHIFFIKSKEIYCNERKKDANISNMTFNLLKSVQNFLKFVHEEISRLSETYNFKTFKYISSYDYMDFFFKLHYYYKPHKTFIMH